MSSSVRVNFIGNDSSLLRSLNRVDSKIAQSEGVATRLSKNLVKAGTFAAAGVIAGLGVVSGAAIKIGVAYQDSLNTLQAVSGATDAQMKAVSKTAIKLGADLTLPATSAADAADAMLELSKGGFSVAQSQEAALGTLQLATAAGYDAAQAAMVQVNTMNQFGLAAGKAGHVADVLANTANAASGGITDIAEALSYAGPIAKTVGVNLEDTATAIGVMANKGILGEKAGTSLRGMLTSLAKPSKEGAKGLEQLGVKAFDSKGKFVGLRTVVDELTGAQKTLTQQQYLAAVKMAFGKQNLAGIIALASAGPAKFDAMSKAVERSGGAADVAKAKSKGLGGAWRGLMSTVETLEIEFYQKFAPALETGVRWLAKELPHAVDVAIGAIKSVGQSGVWSDITGAVSGTVKTVSGWLDKVDWGHWIAVAKTKGRDVARSILGGISVIKTKVTSIFDAVDWSGVATTVRTKATALAQPFIEGVTTGIKTGQWGPLGAAVADGIVAALSGAANLAGKLFGALSALFGKIDWVGVGIQAGTAALPLALGLVAGIINGVTSPALWKGLASHWKEILLAALTIAFLPEGVLGKIGELLARIPFVGKLLAWAFGHFARFAGKAKSALWSAMKFVLGGIGDAIRSELPLAGRALDALGPGLVKRIRGILPAIGRAARGITDTILLKLRAGVAAVTRGAIGLIRALLKPFEGAGTFLYNIGKDIVTGLVNGIVSKFDAVKNTLGGLTKKITSWKGPRSLDRVLLTPAGQAIIQSLIDGFDKKTPDVKARLQKLTDIIKSNLDTQKSKLAALKQTAKDYAGSIASGVMASGALSATSTDAAGTEHKATFASVKLGLSGSVGAAKHFVSLLHRLYRMHVAPSLIQQVLDLGPGAGSDLATAITANGQAGVRQLNHLQGQLAAQAQAAGALGAGQRYGAQIRGQQQIVNQDNRIYNDLRHSVVTNEAELRRLISKIVRDKGHGSVQKAFT